MQRRTLIKAAGLASLSTFAIGRARADTPGVTATELKIGQTQAYSGPASAYGAIGRVQTAFFTMINEKGGIGGRKINFISVDDGYSPPKTVEQTRRLVEQEGVAFIFNSLGTPTSTAVQRYLNGKKVPQLFIASGASKWADPTKYPWTIGWQPSYRTEGQIYAKYIQQNKPDGKVGVLYQNDDFGKDYVLGLKDIFGAKYDSIVIKEASYEVADPTIDSQIVSLQGAGADVLVTAATPKFAAQTIRKVFDLGWKPLHLLTDVSISVSTVINPAGPERAVGIIAAGYNKEESDPALKDDPGMNEWRAFMKKYMPEGDLSDSQHVFGYGVATTLMQTLTQCDGDFSRENVMKQAANLKGFQPPTVLNGITVNTSATDFRPISTMRLQRWNGTRWEHFGELIQGAAI